MPTSALKHLEFTTWNSVPGGNASEAFDVRGFDLAPVLVTATLSRGDRLVAFVEGRRRSEEWRVASERVSVESIMKLAGSVSTTGPAITANLNVDSFDELRVVWITQSGEPQNVSA